METKKNLTRVLGATFLAAGVLALSACSSEVAAPGGPDAVAPPGATESASGGFAVLATSTTITDCTCELAGDYASFAATSCAASVSSSGVSSVSCRGSFAPPPAKTVTVSGNFCRLTLGASEYTTSRSNLVIKTNGDATVRCQFKWREAGPDSSSHDDSSPPGHEAATGQVTSGPGAGCFSRVTVWPEPTLAARGGTE